MVCCLSWDASAYLALQGVVWVFAWDVPKLPAPSDSLHLRRVFAETADVRHNECWVRVSFIDVARFGEVVGVPPVLDGTHHVLVDVPRVGPQRRR